MKHFEFNLNFHNIVQLWSPETIFKTGRDRKALRVGYKYKIYFMKKISINLALFLLLTLTLTSCYTYTVTVGKGAQSGVEVSKMNHYLIYGLAPVGLSDAKQMAGGATDYDVTITHTFIDGLIQAITFGIYTPTTTIVKK